MLAEQAAAAIAEQTGVPRHPVAVVLGSGWQDAAMEIGTPTASVSMSELPGIAVPTALGHVGMVHSIPVGETPVLVLMGRQHLYEGHAPDDVVRPVRAAIAAGAQTVLLTNAAGGIRPGLHVGEPVLISDHINLTGRTPLSGATFVNMVDAWDPRLRELARRVDPSLTEGVYAGLSGPQYETPAEIRMLGTMGADLVGMSTVLEAIACRALDARLLGISLVTNLAAGVTGEALSHAEVLAEGRAAAPRLGKLLRGVLEQL
ncbi:purine-nucleoside phosphorylase [Nocardia cyriacigeorgica]|uniref:purine-nucleoside phosphorylase n=1 Tax=Nocardia cyriacigeorgica TaxID=135487 RepID=UPI000569A67D|nr:purine-nucleoside phosphorylase [Nocardia cyriacigeorgica]MBF6101333.1 purine-nucleoside phosphorylase [Nocardia cyriacigeorgica]MBF6326298.1 purine-nucleoside phosphorylase [Nocardia cyriacigeorgica]MBF6416552.1 purine-nucleoside phosphorylase [Nocardia cyriacigeorgica]MBF6498241.1 purine-nucleoside phosphorylase [Nocardia cyriacigeorgica]TLF56068.1 purine-nucleoside phosphorylase [Nocardia cyriacigeorgica]